MQQHEMIDDEGNVLLLLLQRLSEWNFVRKIIDDFSLKFLCSLSLSLSLPVIV